MQHSTVKKNAVSFKDVQISYLMEGVKGIDSMYKNGRASKATVRRALRELKTAGSNVDDLETWVLDRFGSTGRGRSAPSTGETRSYKAQQVKAGGPFLRLPLDTLGVGKGSAVRVRFDGDKIIVSR